MDATWRPSTHCTPSESDRKASIFCCKSVQSISGQPLHRIGRLNVPGCCIWLRVPEVRWGDVRPPVFPASLEQLRTSKLAKLPQVHERLPPTKAAA
ncbi:hypothetical protein HDV63DRAFT_295577 [Trichoderma sp. SZMC 28014]